MPFLRDEGGVARATITTTCLDPQTGVLSALFGAGTTPLGFDVVQPDSLAVPTDMVRPGRLVTLRATLQFPAVHGTEYHMWIKVYNGIGLPVTLGLHPAPTYFGTPPTVLPGRCVPESKFVNPGRTPPQVHTDNAVVEPNSWLTGGNITVTVLCPQRPAVTRVYPFAGVPPVDFVVDVAADYGRHGCTLTSSAVWANAHNQQVRFSCGTMVIDTLPPTLVANVSAYWARDGNAYWGPGPVFVLVIEARDDMSSTVVSVTAGAAREVVLPAAESSPARHVVNTPAKHGDVVCVVVKAVDEAGNPTEVSGPCLHIDLTGCVFGNITLASDQLVASRGGVVFGGTAATITVTASLLDDVAPSALFYCISARHDACIGA